MEKSAHLICACESEPLYLQLLTWFAALIVNFSLQTNKFYARNTSQPVWTSLSGLKKKKKKRVLVFLCQRPDSGPVRHLRTVIIPYKPEKCWSRPPQTNALWAKPLIRTSGPWNYQDFTHTESMRKHRRGEGCAEWFFSVWPQRSWSSLTVPFSPAPAREYRHMRELRQMLWLLAPNQAC